MSATEVMLAILGGVASFVGTALALAGAWYLQHRGGRESESNRLTGKFYDDRFVAYGKLLSLAFTIARTSTGILRAGGNFSAEKSDGEFGSAVTAFIQVYSDSMLFLSPESFAAGSAILRGLVALEAEKSDAKLTEGVKLFADSCAKDLHLHELRTRVPEIVGAGSPANDILRILKPAKPKD